MAVSMWDVWERAETGPIVPTREFETRVLFRKTQELVKKYGIKYDPESVVPTDDGLIDKVWKAGLELLVEVGVLCTDTERIIKFTEQEVLDTIRFAPREVTLGEGKDAVVVVHRGIEDERLPVIMGGPLAVPISEEIALKAYEAYAREPSLDAFWPGTPGEVGGMPAKAGSPFEMYAEKMNVAWMREAFRRAGRPGLHISGSAATSPRAAIGACSEEWGYRKCDSIHCYPGVNMKVDYDTLCRSEHYHHYGCLVWGCGSPFIGGLFGGPEGAAIGSVAETLAIYMAFRVDMPVFFVADAGYAPGMSARKPMWAASLASAALARHTDFTCFSSSPYQAYAGPCTDMYLYEIAASTIACVVCGAHLWHGGGRQGLATDYFGGPLDTRFSVDVGCAATRLNREKANEIVKAILARYEDKIEAQNPPLGKTFQECNDLKTLRPTKEYLDLYDKVKKELEGLGLAFE
jgi:methylamine--corrinoid protein Co-methyltransferase